MSILVKAPRFKKEVAIGVNLSNQAHPYSDWDVIKNNSINFIDHLDISVLHLAFFNSEKDESSIKRSALT